MVFALPVFPTASPRFFPRFPQVPRPESCGALEPGEISGIGRPSLDRPAVPAAEGPVPWGAAQPGLIGWLV